MTTRKKQSGTDVSAPSGLESRIEMLFETSWEVCNKVGGIYAVLSTKAKVLGQKFGDKLVFIGPDIWTEETPSPHFKERKTMFRSAAVKLDLPWGIRVRTGRWDIPGAPQVILVDPGETVRHLPGIYGDMWVNFGVDSLHSYGDYDESCAFAVASAIVIGALTSYMRVSPGHVVAHFDEWTTGMGLLYLKLIQPKTSTVFTTHATSIGRSICGNGKPLYDYFTNYNGDQMARELNMESKHSLEKAAAHEADCFTTVSEVTARECAQLLGIRPQVVTPNGFEPGFVPKTVRYNRLRREGRQTLLRVASLLDGNEYDDSTFLLATSGRHEYRNKGLDLFLDCWRLWTRAYRRDTRLSPSSLCPDGPGVPPRSSKPHSATATPRRQEKYPPRFLPIASITRTPTKSASESGSCRPRADSIASRLFMCRVISTAVTALSTSHIMICSQPSISLYSRHTMSLGVTLLSRAWPSECRPSPTTRPGSDSGCSTISKTA